MQSRDGAAHLADNLGERRFGPQRIFNECNRDAVLDERLDHRASIFPGLRVPVSRRG